MRKLTVLLIALGAVTISNLASADESALPSIQSEMIQIKSLAGNDASEVRDQPLATCVAHSRGKYFIRHDLDAKEAGKRSLSACAAGIPSRNADDCSVVCY